MDNLENLQVLPLDDGADGLVLMSFIAKSPYEGVKPAPIQLVISREAATLLANELARASGSFA